MANTVDKVAAGLNHLTLLLTGDGTVVGPTIDNAKLVDWMVDGPLKTAWSLHYDKQADMRATLLGTKAPLTGPPDSAGCYASILLIATGVDVTAEKNQITIDVDVDAVDATLAEINVTMSDTTGQIAYLQLIHMHSGVR